MNITDITVIKRNGTRTAFARERVELSIARAIQDTPTPPTSQYCRDTAEEVTNQVIDSILADGVREVSSNQIKDLTESFLFQVDHESGRNYISYRVGRLKAAAAEQSQRALNVVRKDGSKVTFNPEVLKQLIVDACAGLPDVSPQAILTQTERALYDGIRTVELWAAVISAASSYTETDPNYGNVAARLLLAQTYDEVWSTITDGVVAQPTREGRTPDYVFLLARGIQIGVKEGLFSKRMAEVYGPEQLLTLAQHIKHENDSLFEYFGARLMCDRYLMKNRAGRHIETPQTWLMRVAMGQCLNEADPVKWAIRCYELYSSHQFLSSTPTLFNSGTERSQMSSCYLSTVNDDLKSIFKAYADVADMSKYAGGQALDMTYIRGEGAYIRGTNGQSTGGAPWWKIADGTTVAVKQGSKREGALCLYLEPWHTDIFSFGSFRSTVGDESRTGKFCNTSNWIPDLFMKRVCEDGDWWLFSPDTCPDLHDLYGQAFETRYKEYEMMAEQGGINVSPNGDLIATETNSFHPARRVKAMELARHLANNVAQFGNPWWNFKDASNVRNPQRHDGVIHSSNLCTEIVLNTKYSKLNSDRSIAELGETAVCNLSSINLPKFIVNGKLDVERLWAVIEVQMRMLDNVIDLNFYPIPEAENANKKHRPVGLGMMGFHDALYLMRIPYDSEEAVRFSDFASEAIQIGALRASVNLAQERGPYSSFDGSLWSKGVMPLHSVDLLEQDRGKGWLDMNRDSAFEPQWADLAQDIMAFGLRNSCSVAIAPTASIANLIASSNGVDPNTSLAFTRENLSGLFMVMNRHLVDDLKELGLWDERLLAALKRDVGSIQNVDGIPDDIKALYKTAWEIHPKWLIECASRRAKWIDQSQSVNLYADLDQMSGRDVLNMYIFAWYKGLKTTYYLKTRSATQRESAGLAAKDQRKLEDAVVGKACLLSDPNCEACQ